MCKLIYILGLLVLIGAAQVKGRYARPVEAEYPSHAAAQYNLGSSYWPPYNPGRCPPQCYDDFPTTTDWPMYPDYAWWSDEVKESKLNTHLEQ